MLGTTNIKIDRGSSVPNNMVPIQNVNEKHVTFDIPDPPSKQPLKPPSSTFNLLSKLKRVPSSDGVLNELLANQKIILERLDSLEARIIAEREKCQGTVDEAIQSSEPI